MIEEFVPYEQALALKELGFDEECLMGWEIDEDDQPYLQLGHTSHGSFFNDEKDVKAPLWQQSFRWFREKYGLYHSITPLGYNICLGTVGELGNLLSCNAPDYGNYGEAELACLKKLIELLKNEKQK